MAKDNAGARKLRAGNARGEERFFVVVMANGSDPDVSEPFKTAKERNAEARRLHPETEDVIMWADVDADGLLDMGAYSTGFFEEEDEEDERAAA
jgi:hypothetical protein